MAYHLLVLASVLGLLATAAHPAAAAHPHYERLLSEGTFALERGESGEAVRDLRLACFGFLEEPPGLADCLVRLALAQAVAGDGEGFRESFRRVVEVEEAFHAYSETQLPPARRAAFEAEVARLVPPRILAESRPFQHLAALPQDPEAAAPAAEQAPDLAPVAPAPSVPGPAGLGADEAARLDQARALLAAARDRKDLEAPWRLAREVADARPESREAQHLAAVIAYRAARWSDAVTYFRRGGEPDEGSPETLFYFAVALYEVGERPEAAEVLRRSLPRIEHTPFVLSYREKILNVGEPGSR